MVSKKEQVFSLTEGKSRSVVRHGRNYPRCHQPTLLKRASESLNKCPNYKRVSIFISRRGVNYHLLFPCKYKMDISQILCTPTQITIETEHWG